jgi:hypothetical protein
MGASDQRHGIVRPVITMQEELRSVIQTELDAEKALEERRKLGQFSTPFELANDIVSFGLSFFDKAKPLTFFDPAFGTGVFYSSLISLVDENIIKQARGIEIDRHYGLPSKGLWSGNKIDIQIADFTKMTPNVKYNFIICNPPYVRHHLIERDEKEFLNYKTFRDTGVKLSGLAGLYCHFLLQSLKWMEKNGIAGWLIPSEFMDVNYGKGVKHFLLNEVELLRVHRFDPSEKQFNDALVSSVVVWFKNSRNCGERDVEFSFGGSLHNPKIMRNINTKTIKEEPKWTRFPLLQTKQIERDTPRLEDYFSVKRGIATGNNDFFILPKKRIIDQELPLEFFRPVLPSARYLHETEVFSDKEGNPVLPDELFLLDCKLPEGEIQENYPTLWEYLEDGKRTVSNGYLCKMRKCWYYQEHREAPPIVCTYMGREKANKSAFRFILNHSNAIVTNSYLALYPKSTLKQELKHNPNLIRVVWYLLNDIDSESITGEGRVYGGGLKKIEPSELMNVPLPKMQEILPLNPELRLSWVQRSLFELEPQ